MPHARRRALWATGALVAVSLVLTGVSTSGGTAGAAGHHEPRPGAPLRQTYDPLPGSAAARAAAATPQQGTFTGIDGRVYEHSPLLVHGHDHTIYYGEEMDAACAFGGHFQVALDRISKLARAIEKTGRRVLFTVAPNKSSVNNRDLPRNHMPQGSCDLEGIVQQDKALDQLDDPSYVPMRKELANAEQAGQQMYWKLDTHWTTLSSTRFAQDVAARLDPHLAKVQRYQNGQETIKVDLDELGLLDNVYETGPARFTTTPVTVTPLPGSIPYDPANGTYPEHEWTAKPGRRTWPGHTLVFGDSFAYRGLDSLMPLFRHGDFEWIDSVPFTRVLDELKQSDTVVIEEVQRYLPISGLTLASVRKAVIRTLRRYDRHHPQQVAHRERLGLLSRPGPA